MSNLNSISPSFIVTDVKASASFYVDKLGFEIKYMAPEEDPFVAIVGREGIMIFLKAITEDVQPMPNHTRHEWARWDAFISANDPDALYEEFKAAGVSFHQHLKNDEDNLRGFEIMDADGYVLFVGRPV